MSSIEYLVNWSNVWVFGADSRFNSLTTDAECTCHATLAACHQLVQSILKINVVLAKKVG